MSVNGVYDWDAAAHRGLTYINTGRAKDDWMRKIEALIPEDGLYWYLCGPMTGIDKFNYPEFDRIAGILRGQAYPIVSPAEFEHEDERRRILESDGEPSTEGITAWEDCLARDVVIVSHPRCVGLIVIDGWERSRGARLETYVASKLHKPLMRFSENPLGLVEFDRAAALQEYDEIEDAQRAIAEYGGRE